MTYPRDSYLKLGDYEYDLVPAQQKQNKASELRRYNDESLKKIEEYKYKPLRGSKKKIRLLVLRSGARDAGPDINCELVEANYDNAFHIPMVPVPETSGQSPDDADEESSDDDIKDQELKDKLKDWKKLRRNEIKYEALSWCWGKGEAEYAVLITERGTWGEKTYKKAVKEQLALALKYLRLPNQGRTLWIDAICIDQNDPSERNHQVQMMSRIYTRSQEVSIWLGDGDEFSKLAIDFIRHDIMELRNFDALSHDKRYTGKWKALMMLMQREWFSRRWVVQEIALANKATIHCGPDSIPWKEFAVAVELFVEVETATHRLSEIMQKDEKSQHIPGWFEYVSELGASLLVQATGKVFRVQRSPMEDSGAKDVSEHRDDPEDEIRKRLIRYQTIDPLDRRSLLSLEYLVSSMFIFKASEPRDTVYAMLAISRDAAPFASSGETIRDHHDDKTRLIMTACESFLEEKPFTVDYRRPYADVCKDFVHFAIRRKEKLDPAQALDVLCRPWALEPRPGKSIRVVDASQRKKREHHGPEVDTRPNKKSRTEGYSKSLRPRNPDNPKKYLPYPETPKVDVRPFEEYWNQAKANDNETSWKSRRWPHMKSRYFPDHLERQGDHQNGSSAQKPDNQNTETWKSEADLPLPSWIARASQAPFHLHHSPGIDVQKTGRAYADPLVGHPQDGHRNYSAAQTQKLRPLEFRRRPQMGHYSLYVQGFVLDEVVEVMDASQGGNIPEPWLKLANWTNYEKDDPPGEFWRTLVADRGRDNRNPPYYYAKACKESVNKGGIASGRVDTAALIHNERNSIVAEFCRRVHAVIWNRRLFRTKDGRLGLATRVEKADQICILYWCSVPVILRRQPRKSHRDRELEREEDRVESLKRVIRNLVRLRGLKAKHREAVSKPGSTVKEAEERRKARDIALEKLEADSLDAKARPKKGPQTIKRLLRDELETDDELETEDHLGNEDETDLETGHGGPRTPEPPSPGRLPKAKTGFKQQEENARKEAPGLWYKFGGDCYLHGMMDGDAIREHVYQEVGDRVFELR